MINSELDNKAYKRNFIDTIVSLNIFNHLKYSKNKESNKDNEKLVGNEEGLCLKTRKMEKFGSRNRKINSRKNSFLYLITFNFIINQYLHFDFKDFLIKSTFFFIF